MSSHKHEKNQRGGQPAVSFELIYAAIDYCAAQLCVSIGILIYAGID